MIYSTMQLLDFFEFRLQYTWRTAYNAAKAKDLWLWTLCKGNQIINPRKILGNYKKSIFVLYHAIDGTHEFSRY